MERTVLIPLDGSAYAEQGLPTARKLAGALDAALCLIHVHAPLALEPLLVDGVPVIDKGLNAQQLNHERAYLDQLSSRLAARHPALRLQSAVLDPAPPPEGPPARDMTIAGTLAAFAETAASDYVVMTTHGRGGLSRFWLGSVASALIQFARTPLVLLHPHLESSAHVPLAARRVLIPLDGSLHAEAIIDHALRLGRADHAGFTLLRVVEPLVLLGPAPFAAATDLAPERTQAQVRAAESYLDGVAERIRQAGAQAECLVIVSDRPAATILETAERSGADLIALATHGRGGLSRLPAGSVADKVLRSAAVPLLICRPSQ